MDFNPECLLGYLPTFHDPVKSRAVHMLQENLLKKLIPRDPTVQNKLAEDLFLRMNDHCKSLEIPVTTVIQRARAIIYDALYYPDGTPLLTLENFSREGKPGPGASRGTRHTAFHMKMWSSKWTSTSAKLYQFFKTSCAPHWQLANAIRETRFGGIDVVDGSRMSCVPKTSKISRTICTEPSLNMYFQLGAGACLEKALMRGFSINLSTQPDRNKSLARQGSLDGSLSTIDLRSASDTIATKLVAMLLPQRDFSLLELIRSRKTEVRGSWVELHSFSTMGNGFTFPLQTLIFAALLKAFLEENDYLFLEGHCPVFGDDIICPSKAFDGFTAVLEQCGFFVNFDKSFASGFFRESCGGDYFYGADVRSVYIKKLEKPQDFYSAFNRLARWGARHSIDVTYQLRLLLEQVDLRPIPFDEGDDAGIKLPKRALRSPKFDQNGCIYYRPIGVVPVSRQVSDLDENPPGCLISLLGGYIRNRRYTVRVEQPAYKVLKRKTPSWDYVPQPGLTSRDFTQVESLLYD